MVGSCEISKKSGYSSHLGVLGISLLSGYRDVGIGQEMMLETEKQSSRIGVEIVELEVYSLNTRAVHVYERVGYKIAGRLSNSIKREGQYMDTFLMIKQLPLVL